MSRTIKKIVINNWVAKHMHTTCQAKGEINQYRSEKVNPPLIQIELDDGDYTGQMADTFDHAVLAEGYEDFLEWQSRNDVEDNYPDHWFDDPIFENEYQDFDAYEQYDIY